jgi:hypothetical protein
MPDGHTIQRCRWAEPTLFLINPLWMAAEEYPWSCRRDDAPHPVEDTTTCRTCARWQPGGAGDRRNLGGQPAS